MASNTDTNSVSRSESRFRCRAKEEFGKGESASFFLAAPVIRKYSTSIAIPTASEEATFEIDEAGNLK